MTGSALPGDPPNGWLRLDELANAVNSLEMCADFLERLPNPYRWKWAVIALHQAIYGFAVCAVRGTDSSSVLEKANSKGKPHLISVWEALKRAQDSRFLLASAVRLSLTDQEQCALDRLFDEFRNGFAHFQPGGWSIQMLAMIEVFGPSVGVLRRLALEHGLISFHDESEKGRVVLALDSLRDSLAKCSSG